MSSISRDITGGNGERHPSFLTREQLFRARRVVMGFVSSVSRFRKRKEGCFVMMRCQQAMSISALYTECVFSVYGGSTVLVP